MWKKIFEREVDALEEKMVEIEDKFHNIQIKVDDLSDVVEKSGLSLSSLHELCDDLHEEELEQISRAIDEFKEEILSGLA